MRKPINTLAAALGVLLISLIPAVGQKSRSSVSAAEVTGTYRMNFRGKFKTSSNEAKILALGGGKIRFALDLVFPFTMRNGETMVNMGGLDAEADIKADVATFTSDDRKCTIKFVFVRPGVIRISQEGSDAECGFGHNVTADGTYRKVSSRKPRFDEE